MFDLFLWLERRDATGAEEAILKSDTNHTETETQCCDGRNGCREETETG